MYKLKNKLDKVVNVRIDNISYDKLERLFYNRPDEYKHQLRNMSEFIRWIMLNFIALHKNIEMRNRNNIYNNGVM